MRKLETNKVIDPGGIGRNPQIKFSIIGREVDRAGRRFTISKTDGSWVIAGDGAG
jgi:hypothetical protein